MITKAYLVKRLKDPGKTEINFFSPRDSRFWMITGPADKMNYDNVEETGRKSGDRNDCHLGIHFMLRRR